MYADLVSTPEKFSEKYDNPLDKCLSIRHITVVNSGIK